MTKSFLNDNLKIVWLILGLIIVLGLSYLTSGQYLKFCVSNLIVLLLFLITGVKRDLILKIDFDAEKIQVLVLCFGIPYRRFFKLRQTKVKSVYVNNKFVNVVFESSKCSFSLHRMSTEFRQRILDYTIQIDVKQVEDRMY